MMFPRSQEHLIFAALALILLSVRCSDKPVNGNGNGDTTPPTVIEITPAPGDSNVPLDAIISATFSEAMDPASMTAGVLSLSPAVAGSTSYVDSTVSLIPTNDLDSNVIYTATVSTTARDIARNKLETPYTWQFGTYSDTIPPTVESTVPIHGDSSVSVNTEISATFSEIVSPSTVDLSSFVIAPSIVGGLKTSGSVATFTPDVPLDTFQLYTVTVTTAVTDRAGNGLAEDFAWQFYTYPDTVRPSASLTFPLDSAVVGDTVDVMVTASDNDRMDHVEFYVDGNHIAEADDSSPPYGFKWDAVGQELGSLHSIYAVAYDEAGNADTTNTISVHYLWRLLVEDGDEGIPRNLKKLFYRVTSYQVQFRFETYEPWGIYWSDSTGIDVGVFLDIDQDSTTGQTMTDGGTRRIGDIGAEYRFIVGLHGDVFDKWDDSVWIGAGDVENLVIADSSDFFEVSISHDRMESPDAIDLTSANVNLITRQWDWMPDVHLGHVTAKIDHVFYGSPLSRSDRRRTAGDSAQTRSTPFD